MNLYILIYILLQGLYKIFDMGCVNIFVYVDALAFYVIYKLLMVFTLQLDNLLINI